jgi:polysaccharide biosynthesis protein PslG
MKRLFAGLLLLGSTLGLRTAELPALVFPQGVGVNIHFVTGHERDLDLIAQAGFKFVRMDFGWAGIERKQGVYDWAGYDELLANLDQRGIRALFILDYSNPLYEQTVTSTNPISHQLHKNTASPQHPESVAAFAKWAGAAAAHYRGRHVIWEIWNEPNIHFWSPKPDANQYITLALATARAVRSADPQATILGPASSEFPWSFMETLFKAGLLEHLDGISVHPYRPGSRGPETAITDYTKLRELIERYAPPSRKGKLPIISGEWGYSSNTKGVSLQTQADFAVRQQLFNLLSGVPLSIWYDWKNDGNDPAENEHNFGTVFPDLKPKPAFAAIKTLTGESAGYGIASRLELGEKDFVLVCTNSIGKQKVIAWTTASPHPVTVPALGQQAIELTSTPRFFSIGQ